MNLNYDLQINPQIPNIYINMKIRLGQQLLDAPSIAQHYKHKYCSIHEEPQQTKAGITKYGIHVASQCGGHGADQRMSSHIEA